MQNKGNQPTFDGYNKPSMDPKIQALLNEIIKYSISTAKPLPTTPNEEKASCKQSTTVPPPPPQEVVVDVFRKVPTTKVKLLSATPLGLIKRFRKLYKVFSNENTPIQRNEPVSILDEMSRQNVIGPIEYRQINNKLAQSIVSGFEESLVDAENQSIGENMVIDESNDEENDESEDELKE